MLRDAREMEINDSSQVALKEILGESEAISLFWFLSVGGDSREWGEKRGGGG